jgi:hypothetical protein
MSALVKCPSCGGAVSTEAIACPKCGHSFPKGISKQSPILIIGTILLGILIVWFLA